MFDWKRIRLIASREIRTRVAMRSYRISLIVQVLIVALIALSPVIIAKFQGDDSGPTIRQVVVVDNADIQAAISLRQTLPLIAQGSDMTWEVKDAASIEDARTQIESGDADIGLIVTRPDADLDYTLISESGDPQSASVQMLIGAAQSLSIADQIERSGLSMSEVQQVFTPPQIVMSSADTETADAAGDDTANTVANFVIAYAATIIIFIFVVIYGQWIAQGVVEEKASRIMEIMVNAATPRDLLGGKLIGIMFTALMQFIPIVLTAGIIASFQTQIGSLLGVPKDALFDINFGALAWSSLGWFMLYFILGFMLYGALYAGVGSLVSRQEEVSTAVAPMTTVMMVGYIAALASMGNPDGVVARVAFLFPGTSVFVAMLRIVGGNPEPWEIAVSIIGLVIAIVLALLLAARLYRVGVLMYGQSPKFTQIFKLGRMQQVSR